MASDGGVWVKLEDAGQGSDANNVGGFDEGSSTNATFSTITDGGVEYRLARFDESGMLKVTQEGMMEVLVVTGGGGGAGNASGVAHGGSGAGGSLFNGELFFPTGELAVTIGEGGDGGPAGENQRNRSGKCGGSSIIQNVINVRGNNDPGTQTPLNNSTFTGQEEEYGMSSVNYQTNTNPGGGGGGSMSNVSNTDGLPGTKGVVLVRVKTSGDSTPVSYNSASGGTETIVDNYNGTNEKWKVHTFTVGGDTTLTVDSATNPFHVLVAGGGGNSGTTSSQGWTSGAGGGGAVYENESADLSGQATYSVTVGTNGNPGGASILETFPQQNGGVKGGNSTNTTAAGGASGNGNAGAPTGNNGAGGGTIANYSVTPNGLTSSITGSEVLYGSGRADGIARLPNTGSGAGGSGGANKPSNSGENGVVIVAYQIGVSA